MKEFEKKRKLSENCSIAYQDDVRKGERKISESSKSLPFHRRQCLTQRERTDSWIRPQVIMREKFSWNNPDKSVQIFRLYLIGCLLLITGSS